MIRVLLKNEWHRYTRAKSDVLQPLIFFIISGVVFAIALGPDQLLLQQTGPGIIWVLVLLAQQLGLPLLFREETTSGKLELWLLHPSLLPSILSIKLIIHWLSSAFPLLLASMLLGLMYHFSAIVFLHLWFSLLLSSIILSGVGAIIAALMAAMHHQSVLLPIMLLPLLVPVLILGLVATSATDTLYQMSMELLGAGALLTIILTPWLIRLAIRIGYY